MPKQTGLFQALFCSMKIDFDVPRSNPSIFLGARPRHKNASAQPCSICGPTFSLFGTQNILGYAPLNFVDPDDISRRASGAPQVHRALRDRAPLHKRRWLPAWHGSKPNFTCQEFSKKSGPCRPHPEFSKWPRKNVCALVLSNAACCGQ